jgi:hypothetical protein
MHECDWRVRRAQAGDTRRWLFLTGHWLRTIRGIRRITCIYRSSAQRTWLCETGAKVETSTRLYRSQEMLQMILHEALTVPNPGAHDPTKIA